MITGAFILMVAGFINRVLGFVLRIVMVRLIGDEGVGLFQMVFTIYISLVIVTTGGFPTALSKIVSEQIAGNNYRQALHTFKSTLMLVLFLAVPSAILLSIFSPLLARTILSDPRTKYTFMAIAPAIIFCSVASIFRGFFQGLRTMTPTAISQTTEQGIRFGATILLISLLAERGTEYTSAAVALGVGIGELFGFIILLGFLLFGFQNFRMGASIRRSSTSNYSTFQTLKKLCSLAFPITLGQVFASAMQSLDAIIIPARLQVAGYTLSEATSLFGHLSGMANPLLLFPTVVTVALTTTLVPAVSELASRENISRILSCYSDMLRLVIYTALPSFVIFRILGAEICELLFGYPEAGVPLSILAFSTLPFYYLIASSGVLYGLGKPLVNLRNWALGAVVKVAIIYFLTADPRLGIVGASWGIVIQYLIIALFNFIAIGRRVGFTLDLKELIVKPAVSCTVMYYTLPLLLQTSMTASPAIDLSLTIFGSLLLFMAVLIITGGITTDDLKRLLGETRT